MRAKLGKIASGLEQIGYEAKEAMERSTELRIQTKMLVIEQKLESIREIMDR